MERLFNRIYKKESRFQLIRPRCRVHIALFLSLLCGLFYNFWNYEMESIVLEEGNWQARITGTFEEDAVSDI